MISFKNKKWSYACLLPSLLFTLQSYAISEREILAQAERPSVHQTLELMRTGWHPDPLVNASHLPKIAHKGVPELQNDFPTWYQQILQGSPRMIACFEKAFPGATWAFIGRDTAPIADFFEAFYLALGQRGRVERIPMSSNTLASLTPAAALNLLAKNGLDVSTLNTRQHPYIFVDAVSRKGGTQGRYLINTIFKNYKGKHGSLLNFVNFIGLRVSTTDLPKLDACNAYQIVNSKEYQEAAELDELDPRLVLTYKDQRQDQSYLGINEAGYTHWVGAWHGPFGEVHPTGGGWSLPAVGEPSGILERKYVLDYQAHLILAASSQYIHKGVVQAAQSFGYSFPTLRPAYVPTPILHLREELKQAQTLRQMHEGLSRFFQYNLGRANPNVITVNMMEAVNRAGQSDQSSGEDEVVAYLDILNHIQGETKDTFIKQTTATFFGLDPKIEMINRLMAQVQSNIDLNRWVGAEALNYLNLKPTEEAVRDYKALDRPSERFRGQDEYTAAEVSFKTNHLKKTWTLKNLFSRKGKK